MLDAKRVLTALLGLACFALAASGCASGASPTSGTVPSTPTAPTQQEAQAVSFALTSTAFEQGEPIPSKHSCDGEDISPPLQWSDPPPGTASFALIADDPDAPGGTWVHWVLYNLPANTRVLSEAIPPDAELTAGGQHGENGWRRLGYDGPCPPSGTHRYFFKLYALDEALNLSPGENKERLLDAMEGHVLTQTELMGTFAR